MKMYDNDDSILSVSSDFANLPLLRMRFYVKFSDHNILPGLTGSAWRGLIGWKLKKLICPFEKRSRCDDCSIADHCPYYVLYEQKSSFPGLSDTPKGYVLFPDMKEKSSVMALNITLVGHCTKFSAVIAKAVLDGQETGIGIERSPYQIHSWGEALPNEMWVPMPADPGEHGLSRGAFPLKAFFDCFEDDREKVDIQFVTPVRMRRKGKYMSQMDWPFYFSSFFRRVESLNCVFNQRSPIGKTKWKAIQRRLGHFGEVKSTFRWCDYHRYSSRQRKKVPMGGLIGKATVFRPQRWQMECWKAISILHNGKGSSMGLGKVVIT